MTPAGRDAEDICKEAFEKYLLEKGLKVELQEEENDPPDYWLPMNDLKIPVEVTTLFESANLPENSSKSVRQREQRYKLDGKKKQSIRGWKEFYKKRAAVTQPILSFAVRESDAIKDIEVQFRRAIEEKDARLQRYNKKILLVKDNTITADTSDLYPNLKCIAENSNFDIVFIVKNNSIGYALHESCEFWNKIKNQ